MPEDDSQKQAYLYLVAGCCFSIGLKFAGSADPEAFSLLLQQCDFFLKVQAFTSSAAAEKPNRYANETCLAMSLLSVSLVMAATGNLEVLKRLRKLHGRPLSEVSYGSQMSLHQAMGLLFLGGGYRTLGTSNKAVAALIISLYPIYPLLSFDNRYHLQALRHLYVLAIENRCLVSKNIQTKALCQVPVTIELTTTQGKPLSTFFQSLDYLLKVHLCSGFEVENTMSAPGAEQN